MDELKSESNMKVQYLKLIPLDENSEIDHILLGINNKNNDIYKVIEKGKNNSTTILRIDKINYDTSIDNTIFVFNELDYKGYYIEKIKMKIIDKYILTSYLKIFFSFFFILMFIFIFHLIWMFIDDLAGKEIDFEIIFKFLLYYSPKLLPLVIPLTVLLASIMTFGNLSENYELAAIKSSGISLFKSMRSLIAFNLLLSVGMFFVANSLIPYAEFKSYNLRKNLAKLKTSFSHH